MIDREGNAYQVMVGTDRTGKMHQLYILSPARQAKKARGLSGRQWRKYRKRLRGTPNLSEKHVIVSDAP